MQQRQLGPDLAVSAIGLGCMGMSFAYGGQAEADSSRTLRRAVEVGVTFFDTAEVYGPFENEELVGKALKDVRNQVVIATKFGFMIADEGRGHERMVGVDNRPEHVRAVCDASLKRLGVEVIDLFYQHRVDPAVPIEDTVGGRRATGKEMPGTTGSPHDHGCAAAAIECQTFGYRRTLAHLRKRLVNGIPTIGGAWNSHEPTAARAMHHIVGNGDPVTLDHAAVHHAVSSFRR